MRRAAPRAPSRSLLLMASVVSHCRAGPGRPRRAHLQLARRPRAVAAGGQPVGEPHLRLAESVSGGPGGGLGRGRGVVRRGDARMDRSCVGSSVARRSTGPWLASVLGTAVVVVACRRKPRVGALAARVMGCRQRAGRRCCARLSTQTPSVCRSSPARVGRARGLLTGIPIPDASRRPPRGRRATLGGAGCAARSLSPRRRVWPQRVRHRERRAGTARSDVDVLQLVDQSPGPTACEIALPAGASAVWMAGDAALARTAEQLAVTLIEPGAPEACGLRAQRAVVAPAGTLFVVSGRAWAEGAGLWTAGGGEVELVAERLAPMRAAAHSAGRRGRGGQPRVGRLERRPATGRRRGLGCRRPASATHDRCRGVHHRDRGRVSALRSGRVQQRHARAGRVGRAALTPRSCGNPAPM